MTFLQQLQQSPDQVKATKVQFTNKAIFRKFGADIDANQAYLDEVTEQYEAELNSRDLRPTKAIELTLTMENTAKVIECLKALRTELFPNGIEE